MPKPRHWTLFCFGALLGAALSGQAQAATVGLTNRNHVRSLHVATARDGSPVLWSGSDGGAAGFSDPAGAPSAPVVFDTSDGLAHPHVNDIVQIQQQVIFATDSGISVYAPGDPDSAADDVWRTYRQASGLPAEPYSALALHPGTDELWVGSGQRGLARCKLSIVGIDCQPVRWPKADRQWSGVRDILVANDGRIWVANAFEPERDVGGVAVCGQQGESCGLWRSGDEGLWADDFAALAQTPDGRVWAGAYVPPGSGAALERNLFAWAGGEWQAFDTPPSNCGQSPCPGASVTALASSGDADGWRLWAGTSDFPCGSGAGVAYCDAPCEPDAQLNQLTSSNSPLPANNIAALAVLGERLFVAGRGSINGQLAGGGAVARLATQNPAEQALSPLSSGEAPGFGFSEIRGVATRLSPESPLGYEVLVATGTNTGANVSVAAFDGSSFNSIVPGDTGDNLPAIPRAPATALAIGPAQQGASDTVWVSSANNTTCGVPGGVTCTTWDGTPGTWRSVCSENGNGGPQACAIGLQSSDVRTVHVLDATTNVYGTSAGLAIHRHAGTCDPSDDDPNAWQSVPTPPIPGLERIQAVATPHKGGPDNGIEVFVGAVGGAWIYNETTEDTATLLPEDGLLLAIDEPVTAIYAESESSVWFGSPSGLTHVMFDGPPARQDTARRVTHYTRKSAGLPSNHLTDIQPTQHGRLLVATADNATGVLRDGRWHALTALDGVLGCSAVHEDPYGGLWCAGSGTAAAHSSSGLTPIQPSFASIGVSAEDPLTLTFEPNVQPLEAFGITPTAIRVHRSLAPNGPFTRVAELAPDASSFVDPDSLGPVRRYYRLTLVDSTGQEHRHPADTITVTPAASEPSVSVEAVQPPRTAGVGQTVDYAVNVRWRAATPSEQVTLGFAEALPEGLTATVRPSTLTPPAVAVARITVEGYPTASACPNARCLLRIRATSESGETAEDKILVNVLEPGDPADTFITQFFYPEQARISDVIEVRGRITPPPQSNFAVTTTFNSGSDVVTRNSIASADGRFSVTFEPPYADTWYGESSWSGESGRDAADTSGQPPLSPPNLGAAETPTTIALSSTIAPNLQAGDTIDISGKIQPTPGSTDVRFSALDPDGIYAVNQVLGTASDSTFAQSVGLVDVGLHRVRASWPGNGDYRAAEGELLLPVTSDPSAIGMAILVAGGAPGTDRFSGADSVVRFAYQVLQRLQLPKARIHVLHAEHTAADPVDLDDDGVGDTAGAPTSANLQAAIETWARNRVNTSTTSGPFSTPLTLFVAAEGSTGAIELAAGEMVTGTTLAEWLDHLYSGVQGDMPGGVAPPSHLPTHIILETPEAGTLVDDLTVPHLGGAPQRIVLAATDRGASGASNLFGAARLSFSRQIFAELQAGASLGDAWSTVNRAVRNQFTNQRPQLEATGDSTANQLGDALKAANAYVENRPTNNLRPRIKGIRGGTSVLQPNTSGELWTQVLDTDSASVSVEASILPPPGQSPSVVTLTDPDVDGRYSVDYSGFTEVGLYRVIYTVVDDSGNIAVSADSTVSVVDLHPPDEVTDLEVTDEQPGEVTLSWTASASTDVDRYIVSYREPGGSWTHVDAGTSTTQTISGLDSTATYVVRVRTSDVRDNQNTGITLSTDVDGLAAGWENAAGTDPTRGTGIDGAHGNIDADAFTNLQEYRCEDLNQAVSGGCYGGPAATADVGQCSVGTASCDGGTLTCDGEQRPAATDVCGNGVDEDCNGADRDCADLDGDGLQEDDELALGLDPDAEDSDGDGIPDGVEVGDPGGAKDADGDGTIDALATDSDADGIPDSVEAGPVPAFPVDSDEDGTPDYRDTDSDNDDLPDAVEAGDAPETPVDTDDDGATPDYVDTDSDGDGLDDATEAGNDPTIPSDTDGDGTPDYRDTDSDADGLDDEAEPAAGTDPTSWDTDGDEVSDGDEMLAGTDPLDATDYPGDTDGDGIPDAVEDLIGTDPESNDSDGDGLSDGLEVGTNANEPADADGDGTIDALETDSDGDGIPDADEAGGDLMAPVDTDGDGTADYRDTDSDGDGLSDGDERAEGTDPTLSDSDGDGSPDAEEVAAGTDPTDADDVPGTSHADDDSDADGNSDGSGDGTTSADDPADNGKASAGDGTTVETNGGCRMSPTGLWPSLLVVLLARACARARGRRRGGTRI